MPISTLAPPCNASSSRCSPLMDSFTKHGQQQAAPLANAASAEDAAGKRVIVNFDAFLSVESRARYPSPLKDLAMRYLGLPGMINFGGGLPDPLSFPISSMTLSFPYLSRTIRAINTPLRTTLPETVFPTHWARENAEMELDLSSALQYGGSMGPVQVRSFLKEHLRRSGGVGHDDWDLILTNGNTDGLDNAVRMLCGRGSAILVEEFCYPATLAGLRPQGVLPVGLKMDDEGVVPEDMDRVLREWDHPEHSRPRAMIVVPTGQNPTGATMSDQRRREVYAVARKHNIIIICDDPYRALRLTYGDATPAPAPISFLEIDVDKRVIELSSFSKCCSPGCRLGWLVAPSAFITRLSRRNETTIQSVSGFSLAAMAAFLGAMPDGQNGFDDYLKGVATRYSQRATKMDGLLSTLIPAGLISYTRPTAGMFFFLTVHTSRLPHLSPEQALERIFTSFIAHKIILTPCSVFRTNDTAPMRADEVRFRASFSYASDADMEDGVGRMARALEEVFAEVDVLDCQ